MILVNRVVEVWDEQAIESGEPSEAFFDLEDAPFTFKELVREMQDYSETSCWPSDGGPHEWLSTTSTDYRTGDDEITSLHYSRNNHPRSAKYWRKAMNYVFGRKP